MSLEQVIQENTEVMRELIAQLKSAPVTVQVATPSQETKVVKVPIDESVQVAEEIATATEVQSEAAADDEKTEEVSVTFDEVKTALMQVAKRNRGKLIEILAKFGTDKVNALSEADYPAVIKLADEALGGAHA